MLRELDAQGGAITAKDANRNVLNNLKNYGTHMKGLFGSKLQSFIFILLALAYMVSFQISIETPQLGSY